MEKRVKTLAAVICMTALLMPVWQTTELKAAKQDKVTVFAKKKTKKSKKSKKKITYKGIVNITGKNFEKEVIKAKGRVIVDFSAKWCYYCQLLEPLYKEADGKLPQYKFAKVDVDEEEDLAAEQGVFSYPTILIYENGEVIKEGGYKKNMTTDDLVDWIKSK